MTNISNSTLPLFKHLHPQAQLEHTETATPDQYTWLESIPLLMSIRPHIVDFCSLTLRSSDFSTNQKKGNDRRIPTINNVNSTNISTIEHYYRKRTHNSLFALSSNLAQETASPRSRGKRRTLGKAAVLSTAWNGVTFTRVGSWYPQQLLTLLSFQSLNSFCSLLLCAARRCGERVGEENWSQVWQ